jgi:competence transcription factor ComK
MIVAITKLDVFILLYKLNGGFIFETNSPSRNDDCWITHKSKTIRSYGQYRKIAKKFGDDILYDDNEP